MRIDILKYLPSAALLRSRSLQGIRGATSGHPIIPYHPSLLSGGVTSMRRLFLNNGVYQLESTNGGFSQGLLGTGGRVIPAAA